jgi:hypothetical protein
VGPLAFGGPVVLALAVTGPLLAGILPVVTGDQGAVGWSSWVPIYISPF